MNWKEFLKPNWRRIILTIIVLGVSYFYETIPQTFGRETVHLYGLPFPYYQCTDGFCNFNVGPAFFPYTWLIVDIVIWYLLSCLIIWIYDKAKKR